MARTDESASGVRGEQADEDERTRERRRRAAQQDDARKGECARRAQSEAEPARDIVSQGEGVERSREERGEDAAEEKEGYERGRELEVAPRERADRPEAIPIERRRVAQEHERRERGQPRRHGGAGDDEHGRRREGAGRRGHDRDEHRGQECAEQRTRGDAERRAHAEHRDRDDDGERGARVDAEQARVGDGVAGDALHDRPGEAQRGARGEADERTGDAQLDDDDRIDLRCTEARRAAAGRGTEEYVDDRERVDRARADGEAHEHGDDDKRAGDRSAGSTRRETGRGHWASERPSRQYPMKATLRRSTPISLTRCRRSDFTVEASPAIQA